METSEENKPLKPFLLSALEKLARYYRRLLHRLGNFGTLSQGRVSGDLTRWIDKMAICLSCPGAGSPATLWPL